MLPDSALLRNFRISEKVYRNRLFNSDIINKKHFYRRRVLVKSICWAFFIAILLVSCAPMGQNIINRQTKADTSGRKTESFLPFKQVRPLSRETVTAVKDLEGNIWLIEEKAVYLYEKGKLLEAGSSARWGMLRQYSARYS